MSPKGFYWLQSQASFLKAFVDIQSLVMSLGHDIPVKVLVNKAIIGNWLYVSCYEEIRF